MPSSAAVAAPPLCRVTQISRGRGGAVVLALNRTRASDDSTCGWSAGALCAMFGVFVLDVLAQLTKMVKIEKKETLEYMMRGRERHRERER